MAGNCSDAASLLKRIQQLQGQKGCIRKEPRAAVVASLPTPSALPSAPATSPPCSSQSHFATPSAVSAAPSAPADSLSVGTITVTPASAVHPTVTGSIAHNTDRDMKRAPSVAPVAHAIAAPLSINMQIHKLPWDMQHFNRIWELHGWDPFTIHPDQASQAQTWDVDLSVFKPMRLAKMFPFHRDARISFREGDHTYTIDGIDWQGSATAAIKAFFGTFNPRRAAEMMRRGKNWEKRRHEFMVPVASGMSNSEDSAGVMREMTTEEIVDKWQQNGKDARDAGSYMHFQFELYLNGYPSDLTNDSMNVPEIQYGRRWLEEVIKPRGWRPLRTEMLIFADVTPEEQRPVYIAGAIDALFIDEHGLIHMVDFKRSKKIHMQPERPRFAKPPLKHLPDCNFIHYSLQQNLYSYILARWYGVRVASMHLAVFHPDLDGYQWLALPHLWPEIQTIVEHRTRELERDLPPFVKQHMRQQFGVNAVNVITSNAEVHGAHPVQVTGKMIAKPNQPIQTSTTHRDVLQKYLPQSSVSNSMFDRLAADPRSAVRLIARQHTSVSVHETSAACSHTTGKTISVQALRSSGFSMQELSSML